MDAKIDHWKDTENGASIVIAGGLDSSDTLPPLSTANERKQVSSVEGQQNILGTEDLSVKQNTLSPVEETFSKTSVSYQQPKEVVKSKEEMKKEKKDREREEKERKKREKKEKEQREKEEKERKEREKKERKERERREKEEREKREKQEKKLKNEKEKADKEKMEKEKIDDLAPKTAKVAKEDSTSELNLSTRYKAEVVEKEFTKQSKGKSMPLTTITTVTLPDEHTAINQSSLNATEEKSNSAVREKSSELYSSVTDQVKEKPVFFSPTTASLERKDQIMTEKIGALQLQCSDSSEKDQSKSTPVYKADKQFEESTELESPSNAISGMGVTENTTTGLDLVEKVQEKKFDPVGEHVITQSNLELDLIENIKGIHSKDEPKMITEAPSEVISKEPRRMHNIDEKTIKGNVTYLADTNETKTTHAVVSDIDSKKEHQSSEEVENIAKRFTSVQIENNVLEPIVIERKVAENTSDEAWSVGPQNVRTASEAVEAKANETVTKSISVTLNDSAATVREPTEMIVAKVGLLKEPVNGSKKSKGTVEVATSHFDSPLPSDLEHDLSAPVASLEASAASTVARLQNHSVTALTHNLSSYSGEKPEAQSSQLPSAKSSEKDHKNDQQMKNTCPVQKNEFNLELQENIETVHASRSEEYSDSKKEESLEVSWSSDLPDASQFVSSPQSSDSELQNVRGIQTGGIVMAPHSVSGDGNVECMAHKDSLNITEVQKIPVENTTSKSSTQSSSLVSQNCENMVHLVETAGDLQSGLPRGESSSDDSFTNSKMSTNEPIVSTKLIMVQSSSVIRTKPLGTSTKVNSSVELTTKEPITNEGMKKASKTITLYEDTERDRPIGNVEEMRAFTSEMSAGTFMPVARESTNISTKMEIDNSVVPKGVTVMSSKSEGPIKQSQVPREMGGDSSALPEVVTLTTSNSEDPTKQLQIPRVDSTNSDRSVGNKNGDNNERDFTSKTTILSQQVISASGKSPQELKTIVARVVTTGGDGSNKITETVRKEFELQPDKSSIDADHSILDEDFLKTAPKVSFVQTESVQVSCTTTRGAPSSLQEEEATGSIQRTSVPYVTTPTMQRRAHSQRRSREERPPPIDVTYLQDDSGSDDENYVVTEPSEESEKSEDRFRINSSPEILNVPQSHQETRRTQDQSKVKFQLGSLDSQDSPSSEPVTPQTPGAKTHKFTVEKVQEEGGIPKSPASVKPYEIIENAGAGRDERAGSESDERAGSIEREERLEKKLRRVERHFERMASQSLAEEAAPEERDNDFQRMVSQLSREEVADSEDEYENLLIQATTPSDEWDSRGDTDDSPEDRTAQRARQFSDGLGVGRDGSLAQPLSSQPLPSPRNLQLTSDKDEDDDPDSEPAIQEKIKSYSERRAFWEQVSSGSGDTPTEPTAASFSHTAPVPVPRHFPHTESLDSEAAYIAKVGVTSGVQNDAFASDDDEIFPRRKPQKTQSVEESFSAPPPVAVRKAMFERSISLPTGDASDSGRRKKQFEDQIKKDMVAENLLQQLEEEAIPEIKELPHRTINDDQADSMISDETFETDVDSSRSSVKDITYAFEKGWSVESTKSEQQMRDTAASLVEETLQRAENIVHQAEELTIAEPEEEVEEWRFQDVRNRLMETADTQSLQQVVTSTSEEEKTLTEMRRESLVKTHEPKSSKLAEVMQYKSESISKPSDSLEVHVDKSETEDTEKSRDLDEEIKELEIMRRTESRATSADSKGTRGPGDHQSQSSSEDTQCESDVTPEDHPYQQDHALYQPQQHIQDIVWEVGVQEQTEPPAEEFVQDMLVSGRRTILQNGDLDEHTKRKLCNGISSSASITEEEARKVAEELVHDIEKEVSKRHIEIPISDTLRQIAFEKNLEEREIQLMESLLAKRSKDHSHLFSRTDTTTSSMEITDEDLRSSGVEIDLSPTESQSGLYSSMDLRARQEDEKPEALRSDDIDLSDLKPDPIQVEEPPSDRIRKNFSVIEESDEFDSRSDPLDHKVNQLTPLKKVETEPTTALLREGFTEQDDNVAKTDDRSSDLERSPKGSPTGSTASSGGKRTPPPKPERKSKELPAPLQREHPDEVISDFLLNPTERQNKLNERMEEKIAVRTESTDSQKSSSQDDKSPLSGGETGKLDSSDFSTVVRRHAGKADVESSSSGEKSGSALLPDRRSGADFDPYSSSSESHYHSFEQSYSRPCSSDVEGLLAVTTGSSEYESAIASTRSATSAEYQTAVSSLSSRESMKSLDSESSGHLGSVEVSSEASETLVPSAAELEHDDMDDSSFNIVVEDELDKRLLEQYDKIPHRVERHEVTAESISISKFSSDDVSEEDRDFTGSDEDDAVPQVMKRSHEMTFHPEPKPIIGIRSEPSSMDAPEDKLTSSIDDTGSVLSMSISSASETLAVKTVIELSRTDSDKMDGSGNSDQLTTSATSQEISLSSESKEEVESGSTNYAAPKTIESGTSTPTHQRDTSVTSVTMTTSTVDENGIQCSSTQVTSETCAEHPKRSHRRNGSTCNFSSFIPPKPSTEYAACRKADEYVLSEGAESDNYRYDIPLSLKEEQDIEKKDIDERLEESYQTEADQALYREAREQRYTSEDAELDLDQLDGSRPQSQVSKSDSENGNRAVSSGLSDDRPDSELAGVLIRGSSDGGCEDVIERPLTPEPADEVEIKDDTPEFSSEALASVTELELEYSHAFSRTVEYASHVSPIKEKPCVAWEHAGDHEEEMAEAEAAFHMVPHHSPHHTQHHHSLPETILEDEDAEKHELETREAALKELQRRREEHARSVSPGAIPDITVTQHMAPLIDREFKYPDLDLEEQEAMAATSLSSRESTSASETTDTSQGKEYVLDESIVTQSDVSTLVDTTVVEVSNKKSEIDSTTESPTSESFEMLEKPEDMSDKMDIVDDFVIVEEVGKEAQESDCEGKGVRIVSSRIPIRKRDSSQEEDHDFIATSPPPPATRMMDVKYYGEGGMLEEEDDQFHFDGGHVSVDTIAYDEAAVEHFEAEAEAEVEASKKWIEMQFKGEEPASVTTAYNYEMEFERGPLEDIKEEDEMASSSKIGSLGSQKESVGSFGSVKESLSSTPEYDVLAGKKYFTRSGENDDISMSSLQEFESLEQQVALDATHRKMVCSQDSLNGAAKKRVPGDDISLASLQEFEKMEKACFEAEHIEMKARVEEALLSEIDEGHESQVSESDETISGPGIKTIGDSDSEDYDKRMFEIDEIIRQAQSNVERFETPMRGSKSGGPESFGRGDSLEEVARVPDLEFDIPPSMVTSTDSLEMRSKHADSMVTSADSLEVKVSPGHTMATSADSIELQQQLHAPIKGDVMTDSIELPTDFSHMVTSSDSLELETTLERVAGDLCEEEDASLAGRGSIRSGTSSLQDRSSSSGRDFSSSSGKGACGGIRADPTMLGSTDSLEPSSSTATHATYQYETDSIMSSSFTSGGSNTMVSSTETLEAASLQAEGVWYEEPFSEAGPFIAETVETSDDPEFSHLIKRTVQSAPTVRKVTFRGPGAEAALREYVERFDPGSDTVETREVDSDGNVHTRQITQQRVVLHGDELTTADLTGPEFHDYLHRHGMTETDLKDLLTSSCSSSQPGAPGSGAVVATTQQRLTTSHLTGEGAPSAAHTAAPWPPARRPPPCHDISVDDEPEFDVREHDWRFNLQHSAEEAPEDEAKEEK